MPEVILGQVGELSRTGVVLVSLGFIYFVIARMAHRFIDRVARRGVEDVSRAATLWAMLRRLILVAVAVTALLTVANIWGVATGPFLAVGSAIGVALGFGAQDLVKDVIAGFFILAEDQYRIGNVVSIGGVTGVVEDIRPRVTVLRDLDGNVHYVPNGHIDVTTNLTQEFAQAVIDIGIGYGDDIDRAMEVMVDELNRMAESEPWSAFVLEAPQMLGVERLDESSVVLRAVLKVKADQRWAVRREALRRLKKRFDSEKIEIPLPQWVVHRRDG